VHLLCCLALLTVAGLQIKTLFSFLSFPSLTSVSMDGNEVPRGCIHTTLNWDDDKADIKRGGRIVIENVLSFLQNSIFLE
jgi:hypothetical protein